jgi:hypothetical protein
MVIVDFGDSIDLQTATSFFINNQLQLDWLLNGFCRSEYDI